MDSTFFQILLAVLVILAQVVFKWLRDRPQEQPPGAPEAREHAPGPHHDQDDEDGEDGEAPLRAAPGFEPDADARQAALAHADRMIRQAQALLESARRDPATARPAQVMEDYVLPRVEETRWELDTGLASVPAARARLIELSMVAGAVERLVVQRQRQGQRPELRKALGDADELARACYEPVLDFARMNRLALTSAHPVTLLTPFDMGIWVGFIPTGVAPLFLPPAFFEDIRWWPAVAHEIGHDFLAATPGTETRLRAQLGLPSEAASTRIIDTYAQGGLAMRDVVRLYGAWFEEIFCDVFGTMMMGPAYGYTMVALFARPEAPGTVASVPLDASGRGYDVHPPRHLRVLLCARTLRLMGEDEAADQIVDEWIEIHGEQPAMWIPTMHRTIGVPMEVMEELGGNMVTTLYREGMDGLDGHSLSDIPGLAYGPHRAAETRRACDALLAGRPPTEQQARAIVAGAVLAWRQAPEREAAILALARRAIVGVTETRPDLHADAYALGGRASALGPRRAARREALILHTLLSPAPSARRPPSARQQRARQGFLARRSWP